jgi:hypothetical protein
MTRFFIAVTRSLVARRRFIVAGRTSEASRLRFIEDMGLVLDDGRIFSLAGRLAVSSVPTFVLAAQAFTRAACRSASSRPFLPI